MSTYEHSADRAPSPMIDPDERDGAQRVRRNGGLGCGNVPAGEPQFLPIHNHYGHA